MKLLIVDDEPLIRKGLKNQIPWHSIGVKLVLDAASGDQALRIMAETKPDILITDIHMREMTGLELIERTNERYPDVDVIVLTGYDDFEYARSCLRMRVKDFLLKPVDEEQLLALVENLKRKRNGPEAFGPAFAQIKQSLSLGAHEQADLEAQLLAFEKLVADCELSPAQVQRCCFELLTLGHFHQGEGEEPGAQGRLDGAVAAMKRMQPQACVEFTRDFLRQSFGAKAGIEIVERAKRLIEAQLAEDITVASLAQSLYITPAYLSRLFKRATGEGCNEYIVRKRIEQAKALLGATNLKVGEIARMIGYHDNNYFSLAFKKQTGMSPLTYRERVRK